MIVDLTANKINSGIINTGQVSLQGKNGHLRITGNRLQVFDDQEVPIERVSIGDVDMDGSLYGLRVRGEDGFTVLYDEKVCTQKVSQMELLLTLRLQKVQSMETSTLLLIR
ncbi:hypothetical protein AAAC51_07565 [Priestia megaterium]